MGNNSFFYQHPFVLREPVSNNRFSYELRGEEASLMVPARKPGTLSDLAIGAVVFEDKEDGRLQRCRGLASFIETRLFDVPAVIFDNHNHALYFWYEARAKGYFKTPLACIHVDEHSDLRVPEKTIALDASLDEAFSFTNTSVNVGDFIHPCLQNGFFSHYTWVCSEDSLERASAWIEGEKQEGFPPTDVDFVLDFDVDFFSPNMDYIAHQKKREVVQKLARRARFITIATSPFFIDQERAFAVLREIFLG